MITKGVIESIDFLSNTCTVRLPVFEGTSGVPVVLPATFSIVPGLYNVYKPGDIVFTGFENNALNKPIVLGKLFVDGNSESTADGSLACGTLTAKQATLPLGTKLDYSKDPNNASVLGSTTVGTIGDLVIQVQKLEERVTALETLMAEVQANLGIGIT